jgi:hypothetical protein
MQIEASSANQIQPTMRCEIEPLHARNWYAPSAIAGTAATTWIWRAGAA